MTDLTRREIMEKTLAGTALLATAVTLTPATAAPLTATQSLAAAFEGLKGALAAGDLDAFWASIDDAALIIDEDLPFIMSKADFQDHIGFHTAGIWTSFAWLPRNPQFAASGNSGVVAGYATFRGKPKDAGFRQVHMTFTQGWHRSGDRWRLIAWHQSPLKGHILESSPA